MKYFEVGPWAGSDLIPPYLLLNTIISKSVETLLFSLSMNWNTLMDQEVLAKESRAGRRGCQGHHGRRGS